MARMTLIKALGGASATLPPPIRAIGVIRGFILFLFTGIRCHVVIQRIRKAT
jgi:hypothetical protein